MKNFLLLVLALSFLMVFQADAHALVNFADLSYGATATSSSAINSHTFTAGPGGGYADVRDVLGGHFSSYPNTGETGHFIFDDNDIHQWIQVDLGQTRSILQLGSQFVKPGAGQAGDREVWDGVKIEYTNDYQILGGNVVPTNWTQAGGTLGTLNDGIQDVFTDSFYVDFKHPVDARFVRYSFGEHSFDWAYAPAGVDGGGSRIFSVTAAGAAPIPEPATMMLMGLGFSGMGIIRRRKKA